MVNMNWTCTFHVYSPLWVKFCIVQPHVMSLSSWEFHENECSENHTLLWGVNEFQTVLSTFLNVVLLVLSVLPPSDYCITVSSSSSSKLSYLGENQYNSFIVLSVQMNYMKTCGEAGCNQGRTQKFFSGGFNKFSWGQRAETKPVILLGS
jgi:hypothetical protein